MRVAIDLPEDDMRWLTAEAKTRGISQAALIREAVRQYIEQCERKK